MRSIISSPIPSWPASPIPNARSTPRGIVSILYASVTGVSGIFVVVNSDLRGRLKVNLKVFLQNTTNYPLGRAVPLSEDMDDDFVSSFGLLAGESAPDGRPRLRFGFSSFSSFCEFSFFFPSDLSSTA